MLAGFLRSGSCSVANDPGLHLVTGRLDVGTDHRMYRLDLFSALVLLLCKAWYTLRLITGLVLVLVTIECYDTRFVLDRSIAVLLHCFAGIHNEGVLITLEVLLAMVIVVAEAWISQDKGGFGFFE